MISPPGGVALTLTVRQDGSRLCYVVNGSADAPVIRVRQGAELTLTLRNEITDPTAIDAVSGPAKLTSTNPSVPETPGFYRVIPGMRHHASGATNLHVHGFAVPPVKPTAMAPELTAAISVGEPGIKMRSASMPFLAKIFSSWASHRPNVEALMVA